METLTNQPKLMLGEKLKIALEKANVGNTEAASYMGISERTLYLFFKKDTFEIEYLRKAAHLTKQPITYFLEDDLDFNDSPGRKESQNQIPDYLKKIEEKFEMRYEKIIKHYESLLSRYEGVANFLDVSEVPPVPFIKKEMQVIFKKEISVFQSIG
jgi:hypothetical protein